MAMYVIANPKLFITYPGRTLFTSRQAAEDFREKAIENYGITTAFVVCRVTPVESKQKEG